MGNGSGKGSLSPEFLSSSKRFSEAELRDIKKLFISLAYQSRSHGEFVIASVFQTHYGIHGALGGRLFDLVTQSREDKHLYYEDLVIAKALYEKGSPEEMDEFMYQLMDLTGNAHIQRAEIEAVLLSILETVLSPKDAVPDASLPEESLQAFLNAASFTDKVEGDDGQFMSSQNFQKWCTLVPSVKRFLATLLKSPAPGMMGRQVPSLVVPPDTNPKVVVLRREHAWHLAGALQQHEAVTWVLTYHSSTHGLSFNTFLGNVAGVKGSTVLVVRDKAGYVYGGYATQPWERHSDFYGDMKSFLFTLHPTASIFRPTGANNNLQWCASNYTSENIPNGVGFGGQVHHFGLLISSSFEHGHTRHSVTFNNPALSETAVFEPDVIECWAVVVKGDNDQATDGSAVLKGTVLERFKEDRTMLNMVGLAASSDS